MRVATEEQPVSCGFCRREAFVVAEMTIGKAVPLCSDCFAALEPDIMHAARDRVPSQGPPVRRIRAKAGAA